MDWRLRIPGALYRRAAEKAGGQMPLATLVVQWLTDYVDPPLTLQQRAGQARQASMSTEERSEAGRAAARRRWSARDVDPR